MVPLKVEVVRPAGDDSRRQGRMLASAAVLRAEWDNDRRLVSAVIEQAPEGFENLMKDVDRTIEAALDHVLRLWPEATADRDDLRQNLRVHLVLNDFAVLKTYRGESRVRTWIRAVATRFFFRQASRTTAKRKRESGDDELPRIVSSAPSPEARVHRAEQRRSVREALDKCTDAERLLFGLLFEQGLTAEDACKVLGLKPSGVRMRKKRLLDKLASGLAGVWP